MASNRNISFREQLKGSLDDYLKDEGLECAATSSALVEIVADLARYKEEGLPLSPEVYLCEDINEMTSVLQGKEVILIGQGDLSDATARRALKECAPLARGDWAMFIERSADKFRYGVFSATNLPLAMTPIEAIIESGGGTTFSIVARKLAENCVEVQGGSGNSQCLLFSAARVDHPSPRKPINDLVNALTCEVLPDRREVVSRLCLKVLTDILQDSHGSLAVVLSKRSRKIPKQMATDAISFDEPISLEKRVSDYEKYKDNESLAKLQSVINLLRGIMSCDGIVVFRSDASIIGYRTFISRVRSERATGGARRRTFETLKQLVERVSNVRAAFFMSQDGDNEFFES